MPEEEKRAEDATTLQEADETAAAEGTPPAPEAAPEAAGTDEAAPSSEVAPEDAAEKQPEEGPAEEQPGKEPSSEGKPADEGSKEEPSAEDKPAEGEAPPEAEDAQPKPPKEEPPAAVPEPPEEGAPATATPDDGAKPSTAIPPGALKSSVQGLEAALSKVSFKGGWDLSSTSEAAVPISDVDLAESMKKFSESVSKGKAAVVSTGTAEVTEEDQDKALDETLSKAAPKTDASAEEPKAPTGLAGLAAGLGGLFKLPPEKEASGPTGPEAPAAAATIPGATPPKEGEEGAPAEVKEVDEEAGKEIIEKLARVEIDKTIKVSITTPIDDLHATISNSGEAGLRTDVVAKQMKVAPERLEVWYNILVKEDLINIRYAGNPMDPPTLLPSDKEIIAIDIVKFRLDDEIIEKSTLKTLLEEYPLSVDDVPIHIKIWQVPEGYAMIYQIDYPTVGLATFAVLDSLRLELAKRMKISAEELMDKVKLLHLKDRFVVESFTLVDEVFGDIDEKMKKILAMLLVHISHGLGILEVFLGDPNLEEIVVNTAKQPVTLYHKRYNWMKTNAVLAHENVVFNYASAMGRKAGRQITSLDPLMDAHLPTGERVNATLAPVSAMGHTITIRKQSQSAFTIMHMLQPKFNTMSFDMAAMIWMCMQYEMNLMVVGGTASGKTSILNSICSMLATNQHVVTIEDTRELNMPKFMHWNWIPLTTRPPTPEGKGEVTMLDLLVNSLRMRPDRIILGEVRRAKEAQVMFEAMHTGHAAYATFHANLAEHAFRRLTEPPISIPQMEIGALHLFLVQSRNRRYGFRRSVEMVEIMPTKSGVELRKLFKWNSTTDKFDQVQPSQRIFMDVSSMTGLTEKEILQELAEKVTILKWMQNYDIMEMDDVGKIFNTYYVEVHENEDRLIRMAAENKDPQALFSQLDVEVAEGG